MRVADLHRGRFVTAILFSAAGVLLVASVATMYWIGLVALRSNRELAKQRDVIARLEQIGSALKEAETGQRGYLLTGDEVYLTPYHRAEGSLTNSLIVLREMASKGELSSASVDRITRLAQEKLAELAQTIELKKQGNEQNALAVVRSNRGRELMESIRRELAAMETAELAEFEAANRRAEKATKERNFTFIATGVLNLAFLGWAFTRISSEMQDREKAQADLEKSHAELETRVHERTAALEAANRELQAFGYSVSHDLRAPLRHVSSYIKLLEKSSGPDLGETGQRYIRTIAEAAQRMGQLIDDLLVLSRIGRATITEGTVDLEALVQDARKELAGELSNRTVNWHVRSLPKVRGDVNLLRSAVVNLVANAVKYTRRRNPAVIEIGSRTEDGEVVCYVQDNGAGFDMKFVDKLFGVFQRLHDRGEFEGTGIGLASVRRIIQRHGGRTWAEGEVNRGAIFYFSLPNERVV